MAGASAVEPMARCTVARRVMLSNTIIQTTRSSVCASASSGKSTRPGECLVMGLLVKSHGVGVLLSLTLVSAERFCHAAAEEACALFWANKDA